MFPRSFWVPCLPIFLATLPSLLVAQVTGTITGTVRDASSALVPQAKVTATNTETNLTREVMTDDRGDYVIPPLVVGRYQIRVEKDGFSPFVQPSVVLQANTQVQVDANLQIRSATEQVTVSSATNLLQTNTSTMVQVVDQRLVTDLPLNGRNVLQLISLDAGWTEPQN
jgi:hypothetical protein